MNLSEITTKCYILALIIRDDDERLLLGDGFFEFTDKLQHFTPNTFQNDVVELQGTDGQLLAGQVRRTAMQSFDGYIGDATVSQQTTEQNRQRFLAFFRKKHFYKVVYIFPDGTAIKRQRGYIVDAPSIKEMFQRFPEYHVGLNFEDPNYYEYDEDESGQEIFAHAQEISLSNLLVGGLVWDEYGAVSHAIAWGDYETQTTSDGFLQITNDIDIRAPLSLTHLYGNATQETLSGKNKMPMAEANMTGVGEANRNKTFMMALPAGTYTVSFDLDSFELGTNTVFNIFMQIYASSSTALIDLALITLRSTTATGRKTATFTINEDATTDRSDNIRIALTNWNNGARAKISNIQIENGSTATDYEPYVGGVPMPNPQFPSPVNVVSGAQTVKIVGKNLFDKDGYTESGWLDSTGSRIVDSTRCITDYIPINGGTLYTTSGMSTSGFNIARCYYDSAKNFISGVKHNNANPFANTAPDNASYMRDSFLVADIDSIQIEAGQATAYEPYQSQSYTIDLDTTEFAKIGNYTDYIWNDGGTWKIHKEVRKVVLDGTEDSWTTYTTATAIPAYNLDITGCYQAPEVNTLFDGMSDYYAQKTQSNLYNNDIDGISYRVNRSAILIKNIQCSNITDFKTWLSTHNTTVYFPLATAADTEITDSELIEQLDHIYSLYGGVNNLWLIPSGGAQGEIGVRFPTSYSLNGSGYEWEEGAGSAQNIVYVEGIDRTLPVWKVVGPANNPTLTNITTGQTISWQSYVPEGQELIIDMDAQTAMLSGANVFAFIEGEWLELQTGQNRLDYSAEGATDPSTIEWNGVVG